MASSSAVPGMFLHTQDFDQESHGSSQIIIIQNNQQRSGNAQSNGDRRIVQVSQQSIVSPSQTRPEQQNFKDTFVVEVGGGTFGIQNMSGYSQSYVKGTNNQASYKTKSVVKVASILKQSIEDGRRIPPVEEKSTIRSSSMFYKRPQPPRDKIRIDIDQRSTIQQIEMPDQDSIHMSRGGEHVIEVTQNSRISSGGNSPHFDHASINKNKNNTQTNRDFKISVTSYQVKNMSKEDEFKKSNDNGRQISFYQNPLKTSIQSNSIVVKPKANSKISKNKKTKVSPFQKNSLIQISESFNAFPSRISKKSFLDGSTRQKLMIFQLFKMGFRDSNVERAILYGGAQTIEEILNMIIPNEFQQMEHKFISNSSNGSSLLERQNLSVPQFCQLCIRKRRSQAKKTIKHLNETQMSKMINLASKRSFASPLALYKDTTHNNQLPSSQEDDQKIVIMQDRALLCNKKFLDLQEQSGYMVVKTQDHHGDVIHTLQQDFVNKSALSLVTNPHQKTEIPFDAAHRHNFLLLNNNNDEVGDARQFETAQIIEEESKRSIINTSLKQDPMETRRNLLNQINYFSTIGPNKSKSPAPIMHHPVQKKRLQSNIRVEESEGDSKLSKFPLNTEAMITPNYKQVKSTTNKVSKGNKMMQIEMMNQVEGGNFIEGMNSFIREDQNSYIYTQMNQTPLDFSAIGPHVNISLLRDKTKSDKKQQGHMIVSNKRHFPTISNFDNIKRGDHERDIEMHEEDDSEIHEENKVALYTSKEGGVQSVREQESVVPDEKCLICQLPPESHSLDWNMEQLELLMRYQDQTLFQNTDLFQQQSSRMSVIEPLQIQENNIYNLRDKLRAKQFREELKDRKRVAYSPQKTQAAKKTGDNAKTQCMICYEQVNTNHLPSINKHEKETFQYLKNQSGDRDMIKLSQCQHCYCLECIRHHMKQKLLTSQKCPLCPLVNLPDTLISEQQASFIQQTNTNQSTFCPRCNESVLLTSQYRLSCTSCSFEFCNLTKEPWHWDQSCKEHLDEMYDLAASGKPIQMCPHCNQMIEKAQYCNHLTCNFCMKSFCLQCRKDYSSAKLNSTFHDFVCTQRAKPVNEYKRKRDDSSRQVVKVWQILLGLLIWLVLSPLIALFMIPYAATKNFLEYSQRTKAQKHKGIKGIEQKLKKRKSLCLFMGSALIFTLVMLLTPLSFVMLFLVAFTAGWNLIKKQRFTLML